MERTAARRRSAARLATAFPCDLRSLSAAVAHLLFVRRCSRRLTQKPEIDMGLFGPPKTKIAPSDFVKAQLDEIFSDQFTQAESNEFLCLSRENRLFRDVTFERYLRERRNVICNLFGIAWCRNISQAMFLEYSSFITDDPRVAAVHSEAYHCALSRAQQAGMDTFGYISTVFISQILPPDVDNEHPAYRPLYILYGTDFTSRFIALEALIKRHKFVTQ